MISIKRYFLPVLMINSFCLFAMETDLIDVGIEVEQIRDKIDQDHLGMSKDIWFRGIRGTCKSLYKSIGLAQDAIEEEMLKIESYISVNADKELVLKKLEQRHRYVGCLLQVLVWAKIAEIEEVKGSTIDKLCMSTDETGFKKIVHAYALQKFFSDRDKHKYVDGSEWNWLMSNLSRSNDIHFTVLYEHKSAIQASTLATSSDGKYLQSTDCGGNKIIWDMQQGVKINNADIQHECLEWVPASWCRDSGTKRHFVLDETENYYATSNITDIPQGMVFPYEAVWGVPVANLPVKIKENVPAIVLFKRPQEISYLCHQAFYKSKKSRDELIALRDSKSLAAIEGFPQKNLKNRIENSINKIIV